MNFLMILSAKMCRKDIFMSKDYNQCESSGGFTAEEFIRQLWTTDAVQVGACALSTECSVVDVSRTSLQFQEIGQRGEL